ncbi:hypothetical protein BAE44_0001335, partial [Dichanthelium oligosanthes]
LHAGHADTTAAIRRSSWSAAGVANRWSSTSTAHSPSTGGRSSSGSSTDQAACWMTNKQQQQPQQAPSRVAAPNLEISLGRQGWQHNLQDKHQQQQRSGEPAAPKELTLLKCL